MLGLPVQIHSRPASVLCCVMAYQGIPPTNMSFFLVKKPLSLEGRYNFCVWVSNLFSSPLLYFEYFIKHFLFFLLLPKMLSECWSELRGFNVLCTQFLLRGWRWREVGGYWTLSWALDSPGNIRPRQERETFNQCGRLSDLITFLLWSPPQTFHLNLSMSTCL